MPDSTKDVRRHVREAWTLADLRSLVGEVADWDAASVVELTAAVPDSRRGVIAVSQDV